MRRAAACPLATAGEGDTVWMGAIDRDGLAVSYIQSIYWEYGSGCVLPATGIHWQNRGASFALDPGAANPLEPGRRPFHTLIPALAAFADGRVMAYGAWAATGSRNSRRRCSRAIAVGMGVADAVDAPRWLLGRTWGRTSTTVKVENRFDALIVEGSRAWATRSRNSAGPIRDLRPCRHAGAPPPRRPRRGGARSALGRRRRGAVMSFRGFAKRRARNP